MKLTVASIPLEGQTVELTPKVAWLREIAADALAGQNPAIEGIDGNLAISRVDQNVSLRGRLDVNLNPACDRCLDNFVWPLHVDLHIDLSPQSGSAPDVDDLDFSFYRGPEIDLGEIIREQMVLALPLRFICSEACRGLCPQCGANLNVQRCLCGGGNHSVTDGKNPPPLKIRGGRGEL